MPSTIYHLPPTIREPRAKRGVSGPAAVLDRHPLIVVLLLLAVCVALTLPHALAKPFWHDEIYTILVSRLPSFQTMWRASLDGVDLSPPLSTWLTRAAHAIAGAGPVSTRLPAMCGFYLSVVAVFLLLRRRVGSAVAISGALLLLFTAAPRYAAEARAYGMMLGLFASVLFLWMEAAEGRRRPTYIPLLAVALAGSIWNHYYGVLAFAPVVGGEAARIVRRRRLDVPIAAAIGAALVAAVPLWPLMRVASAQRSTFWVAAAPGEQLLGLYRFVAQPLLDAPLILAGIVVALVFSWLPAWLLAWLPAPRHDVPAPGLPHHERVAVLVALTIPLLGFLLGRFVTGGLAPRYVLSGAIALSIAVPVAFIHQGRRRPIAELLLLGTLTIGAVTAAIGAWYPARTPFIDPVLSRPLLIDSLRQPGPTVVSSSLQFLQLWYYTPPSLKPKVRYLTSTEHAVRWSGSDTIDRGYQALARSVAVPAVDYQMFITNNRQFRVYETGSGWLLDALQEAGATVELTATEPGGRLYFVRMPEPGPHLPSKIALPVSK